MVVKRDLLWFLYMRPKLLKLAHKKFSKISDTKGGNQFFKFEVGKKGGNQIFSKILGREPKPYTLWNIFSETTINGKFEKIQTRSFLEEQNQHENIQIYTYWSSISLIIDHITLYILPQENQGHLYVFFYHFLKKSGFNISISLNYFKISFYWMYFKIIIWLLYWTTRLSTVVGNFVCLGCNPAWKCLISNQNYRPCENFVSCFKKYRAHYSTYLLCICLLCWWYCVLYHDYLCNLFSAIYFGFLFDIL